MLQYSPLANLKLLLPSVYKIRLPGPGIYKGGSFSDNLYHKIEHPRFGHKVISACLVVKFHSKNNIRAQGIWSGLQKAVLYLSFGWMPSCQNPALRSNFENTFAFERCWNRALLFGRGNLSSARKWLGKIIGWRIVVATPVSNKAITGIGLEYVSRRMWTWAIGVGLVNGAIIGWDV